MEVEEIPQRMRKSYSHAREDSSSSSSEEDEGWKNNNDLSNIENIFMILILIGKLFIKYI